MAAVADATLAAGGEVTGVIPRFMIEQGWHHTGLTKLVEVENMHERKQLMADLSDAVIALPGGCGTFGRIARSHYLETIGTVSESDSHIEYQGVFRPVAGYVAEGCRRKLHACAAQCHLACSRDSRGKRLNWYIPYLCGMPLSVSLQRYDKLVGGMDTRWSGRCAYSLFSENGRRHHHCAAVLFFLSAYVLSRSRRFLLQLVKDFLLHRERTSIFATSTAGDMRYLLLLILQTCILSGSAFLITAMIFSLNWCIMFRLLRYWGFISG